MRSVARTAVLGLSLVLCACEVLLGNVFDNLQPGEASDASSLDVTSSSDALNDVRPYDPRLDAPSDAGPRDAGADADSATAPSLWSTTSTPYGGTTDPYFYFGGGLSALSRIDEVIDTFTIGFDGNLWSAGWRENGWNTPYQVPIDPNVRFVAGGGVAAVSPDEDYIYVYSLDQGGLLYQAGTWHDQVWSPPELVQAGTDAGVYTRLAPGGDIAAVAYDEKNVAVVTIGLDGYLWIAGEETDGIWSIPVLAITQGERFKTGGGIAAIARDSQHLETFVIGPDGRLWSSGSRVGQIWSPGQALTSSSVLFSPGAEIAATDGSGTIEVWTVGDDEQLWNVGTWDGVTWHDGYKVPVPNEGYFSGTGGLGAALRALGTLEIYAIGFDAHLWSIATRCSASSSMLPCPAAVPPPVDDE